MRVPLRISARHHQWVIAHPFRPLPLLAELLAATVIFSVIIVPLRHTEPIRWHTDQQAAPFAKYVPYWVRDPRGGFELSMQGAVPMLPPTLGAELAAPQQVEQQLQERRHRLTVIGAAMRHSAPRLHHVTH